MKVRCPKAAQVGDDLQSPLPRRAGADHHGLKLHKVTDAVEKRLPDTIPAMLNARARILEPLAPAERQQFMRVLCTQVVPDRVLS